MSRAQKGETERLVAEQQKTDATQLQGVNQAMHALTNDARAEHAHRMQEYNAVVTDEQAVIAAQVARQTAESQKGHEAAISKIRKEHEEEMAKLRRMDSQREGENNRTQEQKDDALELLRSQSLKVDALAETVSRMKLRKPKHRKNESEPKFQP